MLVFLSFGHFMLVVYCPGFPSEKFSWDFSAILCLFLRPDYAWTHIFVSTTIKWRSRHNMVVFCHPTLYGCRNSGKKIDPLLPSFMI